MEIILTEKGVKTKVPLPLPLISTIQESHKPKNFLLKTIRASNYIEPQKFLLSSVRWRYCETVDACGWLEMDVGESLRCTRWHEYTILILLKNEL
jgi:hypothetical protein